MHTYQNTIDPILRKHELRKATGLSDSTVWRLEQAGQFPRRIKLSKSAVGWLQSQVDLWLKNRAKGDFS